LGTGDPIDAQGKNPAIQRKARKKPVHIGCLGNPEMEITSKKKKPLGGRKEGKKRKKKFKS